MHNVADEPAPDPGAEPSAWTIRDQAIRRAQALAKADQAYRLAPVQGLQVATQELKALLSLITNPPEIWVRCEACGWRFTKWQLGSSGHVLPVVRANASTTPGWEAILWLDKANNKKGSIDIGKAAGGDGRGTQNYRCPKCRKPGRIRNASLSASHRLQLYLKALLANETETFI